MKRLLMAVAATVLLTGCGTTAADLPLPGGSVDGPTYELKAEFEDALNLAVGAPVKVDGVTVGRVRDVEVRDFTAHVTLDVKRSTPLRRGAEARLRSTTPLGELFVQIDDAAKGTRLAAGATLGTDDTSVAPTIEDTMTSASMLINGGGLGQLQTIVREANAALGGHEDSTREVLGRLASTAAQFNASSDDIDAAVDALAAVSGELNRRRNTINGALKDLAPAAKVLRTNTDELADLLSGVDKLGTTAIRVVDATRDDLLKTLHEIGPVLDEFSTLETSFGPGLSDLVTFGRLIDKGVPGDFLNTYLYFQDTLVLGDTTLPKIGDELRKLAEKPGATPAPNAAPDASMGIGLGGLLDLLGGTP
ncbi:MCE family protein [Aeromicrobium sp. Root236]|uniref:MCE family protein n=1 Tax=Aeromicrobium sp. Root236 TaxID=1736498 RepID=UPI0009E819CF|nr:MCE family protein [Aeromicrobium sp. Root236]